MQDPLSGLASIVFSGSNESVEPIDPNTFVRLMEKIQIDAEAKWARDEAERMLVDFAILGTPENPFDLTGGWG